VGKGVVRKGGCGGVGRVDGVRRVG